MNRSTGTGLVAFGIVLGAIGAILEFAVTVETNGFNINTVGMIMLIVGIVAFVVGLVVFAAGSSSRTTIREDVRNTPGGQQRVSERQDFGAP